MACRWPGSAHDEQGRRCWRSRAACCVRVPRPGCHPARRCFAARAACSALAPPPRAPRARLSVERTPRRRSWAWGNLRAQGQACCSARSWTLARFSVASRSELALWGSRPARARVAPRMPWEPRGAPAPGLRRLAMAGPAPGIRAGSPDRVCRSLPAAPPASIDVAGLSFIVNSVVNPRREVAGSGVPPLGDEGVAKDDALEASPRSMPAPVRSPVASGAGIEPLGFATSWFAWLARGSFVSGWSGCAPWFAGLACESLAFATTLFASL